MLPDKLLTFLNEHPELKTVDVPEGWSRLESLPLKARVVEFLMPDGTTRTLAPSNTILITMSVKPIGWRQVSR